MSAANCQCNITRDKTHIYLDARLSNGVFTCYAENQFPLEYLAHDFPNDDYDTALMIAGYARLIREFAEHYGSGHLLLRPRMITGYKTANGLTYLEHGYPLDPDFTVFHLGSCHGMYMINYQLNTVDLVAIINEAAGNGHLNDLFEYYEDACKLNGFNLRVTSFFNPDFRTHLINKRGFVPDGDDVIKIICQ